MVAAVMAVVVERGYGAYAAGSCTTKRAPSTSGAASVMGRHAEPVLGPDLAAMRLDDLLGDRKAEAGIVAEALMRPVGIEALEDLLDRVGPDARTVVVDDDLDHRPCSAPRGDAHGAAGRARTSAHCRSGCRSPGRGANRGPAPRKSCGPPPSKASATVHAVVVADLVGDRDHGGRASVCRLTGADSCRCNSASSRLASEMSEISRSRRLTSCWITANSRSWLSLGLGERHGFDRRTQRGQRILQLMRHVGGEALDRLDAAVERVGHVAQRAGQMADLVAPVGEIRDFDARAHPPPHPLGGIGEAAHRTGDGAGEEHRQHDHDHGGDQEHLQDREPLGCDASARCRRPGSTAAARRAPRGSAAPASPPTRSPRRGR